MGDVIELHQAGPYDDTLGDDATCIKCGEPFPCEGALDLLEAIAAAQAGRVYLCLLCLRRTSNPNDVREGYCSCCGSSVDWKPCEHRRPGTGA